MPTRFDWDPVKAEVNRVKHGVTFTEAIEVFDDPLAISRLDDTGGLHEERWITVGRNRAMRLLLVVHTYVEVSESLVNVRVISARRPTKREGRCYAEGTV